jgi:hypothetical protein
MLTTTTPRLKSISPQERLLASFEQTDRQLNQYRLADHADLKDAAVRMGHPMFHTEMIQRVAKLSHSRIWAEDSRNDDKVCGFYHAKDGVKTFICAFDKGPLPEFSYIITDNADLPIKEKRGWRSVLVRLLKAKAIDWSDVMKGFGDTSTIQSDRWRANTSEFRSK